MVPPGRIYPCLDVFIPRIEKKRIALPNINAGKAPLKGREFRSLFLYFRGTNAHRMWAADRLAEAGQCYNTPMGTKTDLKSYRERWKAVEEIERQELRASTVQTNWKQLNSILRRSVRLGIVRGDDDGEMEIFNRWAALRKKYE